MWNKVSRLSHGECNNTSGNILGALWTGNINVYLWSIFPSSYIWNALRKIKYVLLSLSFWPFVALYQTTSLNVGFPCTVDEKEAACGEKQNPAQWTEELDRTFHRRLIRGSFQRVSVPLVIFLSPSSQKSINIPSGLSVYCQYSRADFRKAHLKKGLQPFH